MAFSYGSPSAAGASNGVNAQNGPDLEDIQTEVCYIQLGSSKSNLEYRAWGSQLSPENPRFNYFPRHGLPTAFLLQRRL
jgi:hypothetical protein